MKDNKLEVGDEVYQIDFTGVDDTVVTQIKDRNAILKNGDIVSCEPMEGYSDLWSCHVINRGYKWYKLKTDKDIQRIENAKKTYWVETHYFSEEQKIQIYDLLNK